MFVDLGIIQKGAIRHDFTTSLSVSSHLFMSSWYKLPLKPALVVDALFLQVIDLTLDHMTNWRLDRVYSIISEQQKQRKQHSTVLHPIYRRGRGWVAGWRRGVVECF